MNLKQQLIADVERLPEHSLHLVSVLIKEIISMEKPKPTNDLVRRPPFTFGSMEGKIFISDDFDAPIDDMKEYME
jgi:hypothetical protein